MLPAPRHAQAAGSVDRRRGAEQQTVQATMNRDHGSCIAILINATNLYASNTDLVGE